MEWEGLELDWLAVMRKQKKKENRENADLVVLELILIMRIGEHAPKGTLLLEVI